MLGTLEKGKSGTGAKGRALDGLTKINKFQGAEQISCGRFFCLGIDEQKRIFSWGDNSFGQLGGSDKFTQKEPAQIKNLANIPILKVVSPLNLIEYNIIAHLLRSIPDFSIY